MVPRSIFLKDLDAPDNAFNVWKLVNLYQTILIANYNLEICKILDKSEEMININNFFELFINSIVFVPIFNFSMTNLLQDKETAEFVSKLFEKDENGVFFRIEDVQNNEYYSVFLDILRETFVSIGKKKCFFLSSQK